MSLQSGVGDTVGAAEGPAEGAAVGFKLGLLDGAAVGGVLGGGTIGAIVGLKVGLQVLAPISKGLTYSSIFQLLSQFAWPLFCIFKLFADSPIWRCNSQ